ncbi:NAD(P)H-hydrate dehydratase [Lactobacillus salivarius]|uniref:NAD(P)H-hydrate dehydratase n=1 Tax=Ligilactobacillus salivarius TaxID=1624 RepID=UPI0013688882|nr:NAD(P)H-hydrate dehydratase [Ligilactobacillus salivarius]MYV02463.1 NAD(P)H-hydrate dehydratase [Ligilactobacillus salivarius]
MEITLDILQKVIKKREPNSHKGNFGRVLFVGGNINYGGAIIMAASAAVHAGAGLVTVATNKENLSSLHSVVPEAMFINFFDKVSLTTAISTADAVVVGPGLGTDNRAKEVLEVTLSNISDNQLCIIDGSAITLISENDSLKELIANNKKIIFTPHQMEWQRLSGIPIDKQIDDINLQKQTLLNATVILKKHHTTIYHQSGTVDNLTIGGPFMSTGGMGDILTGILVAFITQFKDSSLGERINAAVYLHSYIAENLSHKYYVTLPTDIIKKIQKTMLKVISEQK